MMEGPREGELPLQLLTHTFDAAATPAVPDPAFADPMPPKPNPAPALPAAPDASSEWVSPTRACLRRAGAGAWLKRLAWVKPSTKLHDTMWA